jgi:hypothetical protein
VQVVTANNQADDESDLSDASDIPNNDISDGKYYRQFCLERLRNLVLRRAELEHEVDPESAFHGRLVARAIFSAYQDCCSAGCEDQARRMVGKKRIRAKA